MEIEKEKSSWVFLNLISKKKLVINYEVNGT